MAYWSRFTPSAPKQQTQFLADRIFASYVESKFDPDDRKFLPAGCIEDLVTERSVRMELDELELLEDVNLDPQ